MLDPARSFDRAADAYELARPSYPETLLDELPIAAGATVLDLGAGTGKLTRLLVRRYAAVVAVEPLEGMRAILVRVAPEAEALAGSAESIPLGDGVVDAVFAAQAFHWFATDEAVGEIARVLRPGGVLAVLRNEAQKPSPLPEAYLARSRELLGRAETGRSDGEQLEVLRRGPFGDVRSAAALHELVLDREAALAFLSSASAVARLPDPERARVTGDLGALLPDGTYRFVLEATLRWALRR